MVMIRTVECPQKNGRKEIDGNGICEDSKNCNHVGCEHNDLDTGRKKERPGVIFN